MVFTYINIPAILITLYGELESMIWVLIFDQFIFVDPLHEQIDILIFNNQALQVLYHVYSLLIL